MRWFVCALALVASLASCIDDAPVSSARLQVIDGEPTPIGLFPATGAMLLNGEVMCTGTLISPTVVLTAAHCVDLLFTGGLVPAFTLSLDGNVPDRATWAGADTLQHPDFNLFTQPEEGVQVWNDVGLLILAEPAEGAAYELLPTPEEAEQWLTADSVLDIVGYGITDAAGQDFGVKTHGVATLVEVGTHELFIGKPGEQQNCNGDSGGPALLDVDDGRRLVGVVSRSPDQNPTCDHGGIDTRIDPYVDWIVSVAPQLCAELDCGDQGIPRPPGYWPDEEEPQPDPPGDDGFDSGCAAGGGAARLAAVPPVLALLLALRRRRTC